MQRELRQRLQPLVRWEAGLAAVLIAIGLIGTQVSAQFLTQGNLFYLCISIGEIAIMTLPLTLIVVTGEIDLSVASILGLSSAMLGYLTSHGWSVWPSFAVVLVLGAAAGLFNGILITRFGLPSLAVTIGTLTLYRGLAVVILGPNIVSTFPERFTRIGIDPVDGTFLSWSVLFFAGIALVFGVALHLTPFGRSLFAIGLNTEAARFAGIRVKRIKLWLYVLSGIVCAFAGILYTFRLSTAVQDNGLGLELNVVAIVLLSGVSIFGGRGSIVGVVLGVFVYAALQNALFLTSFPQRAFGIVTGGLLLISVLVPNAAAIARRARALQKRRARGRAALEAG
jgi:rhamnose transport system permease protein